MKHNFWPVRFDRKEVYEWLHCKCCPCGRGVYPTNDDAPCPNIGAKERKGEKWSVPCRAVDDGDFFLAKLLGIRITWNKGNSLLDKLLRTKNG